MRSFQSVSLLLIVVVMFSGCTQLPPARITFALSPQDSDSIHQSLKKKFVVAAQGKYTSLAAEEMISQGGNIIDAFAAASFTVSVERPHSTGLGGGGFALVNLVNRPTHIPMAVDFREKAPLAATEKMFLDNDGNEIQGKSINGIFSAGTPGMVAGVLELHERFGHLPLTKILAPAIRLARNGFTVYPELAEALELRADVLRRYTASKKIFFRNDKPLKVGDKLVQSDLAGTLELIARKGKRVFYEGEIAKKMALEFDRLGGAVTLEDLKNYDVRYRDVVEGEYHGYKIYSMPPPSSGGVHVIQILNILKNDNLKQFGPHHFRSIHLTASAMQAAFADRAHYLGDSDFVKVPVNGLISDEYAKDLRFSIPENQALNFRWSDSNDPNRFELNQLKMEHTETTHISMADSDGNMISTTQTINGHFGSGVVVPGTGIILNNEMDDFSTKPGAMNIFGAVGSVKNKVEPYKRPLSSMSPTFVYKDGKPYLAVGSPNGTRIISCVVLTLLNRLEYDLSLYDSVALARYHHQWMPDEIRFENSDWDPSVIEKLKSFHHQINISDYGCKVQAVMNSGGLLEGVSDPRGRGYVAGE